MSFYGVRPKGDHLNYASQESVATAVRMTHFQMFNTNYDSICFDDRIPNGGWRVHTVTYVEGKHRLTHFFVSANLNVSLTR